MSTTASQVLVVGAGPSGLALALWLARAGIRPRIIERERTRPTTSRAIAVQARTLELYRQLGLAEEAVERGRKLEALNLWVRGRPAARIPFGELARRKSRYPYLLMLAQDEHERLLEDALAKAGVTVERGTTLDRFENGGRTVRAHLTRADGGPEIVEAAFLAGCDGARSAVRHGMKVDFPGGTYAHLFYVADLQAAGPGADGELYVALDDAGFLAAFPLKGEGHVRLIGTVRVAADEPSTASASEEASKEAFGWSDVDQGLIGKIGVVVRDVTWFSTYRVHHRVVDRFRAGPVFLVGDAAHIHSPVGGQGMNTGIGDAFNLAWKLAAVLHRRAPASLLDTYEPERRAFALRLVATTDRLFKIATRDGAIARWLRTRAVPSVLPRIFDTDRGRAYLFATVSQTRIRYRTSALSRGRAGSIHAGDRLPWIATTIAATGSDNFAPLEARTWQGHVYGHPPHALEDVSDVCERRGIQVVRLPWRSEMSDAGLEEGAFYLVRPDGYLGFVASNPDADAVQKYLDDWWLATTPDPADAVPPRPESRSPLPG